MIDLTAAFDTVDHDVLLSKLQQMFGINGVVLAAVIYQIEATEYIRWSFVWQYLDNLLSCTGLCLKTVTVYTVRLMFLIWLLGMMSRLIHLPMIHSFIDIAH